jgi:undecaprenyl-diphosphatase
MMEILLFGVLQGVFEWLPISSQGNLVLLMVGLMGMAADKAVELAIFLHAGTLLSVLVYFRRDVWEILNGLKRYRFGYGDERNGLVSFLIVSTVVTGIAGFLLFSYVAASAFAGEIFLGLVGIALIITGMIQKVTREKAVGRKLNFGDSLLLGFLQGLSVIPGISRSGITVSGFLFRGYKAKDALRLSFLMSIPAVLGAEIGLGLLGSLPEISLSEALAGIISSFIVGLVSIGVLMRVARKTRFWVFCVVIGATALVPVLGVLV